MNDYYIILYWICYYYFFYYLRGVLLRRLYQYRVSLHWISSDWQRQNSQNGLSLGRYSSEYPSRLFYLCWVITGILEGSFVLLHFNVPETRIDTASRFTRLKCGDMYTESRSMHSIPLCIPNFGHFSSKHSIRRECDSSDKH